MSYYTGVGGKGDYYRRGGRGGLLDIGKRLVGGAVGFLTGGSAGAISGLLGGGGGTRTAAATSVTIQPPSIGPVRLGPTISATRTPMGAHATPAEVAAGLGLRKSRRMNVTNVKALRRAIRRQDGFVQLAKRMGMVQKKTGRQVLKPSKARKR